MELCSYVRFTLNLSFPPGCSELLGMIWERPGNTSWYPLGLMLSVHLPTAAPLYKSSCQWQKHNILETSRGPPSLGSCSVAQGDPLSSSSHFSGQQLPGKSWANNVGSSKIFLVKTYGDSGVHPGALPSSQSLWLH